MGDRLQGYRCTDVFVVNMVYLFQINLVLTRIGLGLGTYKHNTVLADG
jgi:hypothetical protein